MTLTPTSPHRTTPPLQSGDRLSQPEFHRRYELEPDLKHVELIEGVVFLASPIRVDQHAEPHMNIMHWLSAHRLTHPEVRGAGPASMILDGRNEPEPDAVLFLKPEAGGQTHVNEKGYLVGAPELVIEISASSVSIDLGAKMTAYARNGVREYIVWHTFDAVITWFALRDGDFVPIAPDNDGVVHSIVFPGLALDVPAMLAGDMARVLEVQRSEEARI